MPFWKKVLFALFFLIVLGVSTLLVWFYFFKPPALVLSNCTVSTQFAAPGIEVAWLVDVAGGKPPYAFSWSSNSQLKSTATSAVHAFHDNGRYGAEVVVRDAANQATVFQCPGVIISDLDFSACSSDPPSTSTVNSTVVWIASYKKGESPMNFAWQGNDGLSGNAANTSIVYQTSGIKKAVGCITDALGKQICRECQIEIQ